MTRRNGDLIADMKDPRTGVVLELRRVGPKHAAAILAGNTHNRKTSKAAVARYKVDMAEGEWPFLGDPVRIARDGTLLDGQHRLKAIVASGVEITLLIIRDMDPALQEYMDNGAKRSPGQVLGLRGQENTNTLGAMLKRLVHWEAGRITGRGPEPTRRQMLALIDRDPVFANLAAEAVHRAASAFSQLPVNRHTGRSGLYPSLYAFAFHVCAQISYVGACDFFERLAKGLASDENDPVLTLRRALQTATPAASHRDTEERQLALTFTAWNLYRRNETRTVIRYASNMQFPRPI